MKKECIRQEMASIMPMNPKSSIKELKELLKNLVKSKGERKKYLDQYKKTGLSFHWEWTFDGRDKHLTLEIAYKNGFTQRLEKNFENKFYYPIKVKNSKKGIKLLKKALEEIKTPKKEMKMILKGAEECKEFETNYIYQGSFIVFQLKMQLGFRYEYSIHISNLRQ